MTKEIHAYCIDKIYFPNLYFDFIGQVGVLELCKSQFPN